MTTHRGVKKEEAQGCNPVLYGGHDHLHLRGKDLGVVQLQRGCPRGESTAEYPHLNKG